MAPSKIWYMNARARRFLESTALAAMMTMEIADEGFAS